MVSKHKIPRYTSLPPKRSGPTPSLWKLPPKRNSSLPLCLKGNSCNKIKRRNSKQGGNAIGLFVVIAIIGLACFYFRRNPHLLEEINRFFFPAPAVVNRKVTFTKNVPNISCDIPETVPCIEPPQLPPPEPICATPEPCPVTQDNYPLNAFPFVKT